MAGSVTDRNVGTTIISAVATQRKTSATTDRRPPLYVGEHMDHCPFSDAEIAQRLGVDRVTIHRYRKEQHRLNPDKLALLANAIGIEPAQFWYPPTRPSLDAMVKHASPEQHALVVDLVSRILQRPS